MSKFEKVASKEPYTLNMLKSELEPPPSSLYVPPEADVTVTLLSEFSPLGGR
jgi:hypothetical protein